MSSLFIIGNGFDIAHGIPTTYNDFRKWLINQYPDSIIFRENTISLEEYGNLPVDIVAAETLVYAMDNASGERWNDFEEALSRINFFHKIPRLLESKEDEFESEHNERVTEYLLSVDLLSSAIIKSAEEYWPLFFSDWIKTVEEKIEGDNYKAHNSLLQLFSDSTNKFMNFNYTKTLQNLYGVSVVKHIHNRVGQKLIFGHGNLKAEYEEPYESDSFSPLASTDLNAFIQSFRKDTDKQIHKYSKFFKNLDSSIDKVYSYGFSYSKVDSPYIKLVIDKISPNTTWYFTEFETKNAESLRIKKIKLRKYGFKGSFNTFIG